ncbi:MULTISPECIES: hypothetical protein [Chitinophagaceae]
MAWKFINFYDFTQVDNKIAVFNFAYGYNSKLGKIFESEHNRLVDPPGGEVKQ